MSAWPARTPMVGRDEALAALLSSFEDSRLSAVVVMVGGEGGIGKTRLLEDFGEQLRARQVPVLVGGSVELGGDPIPYAPLAEIMRGLRRSGESSSQLDAQADLEALLGVRQGDITQGRSELFERVLRLFEDLVSASGRTALAVEDLHWADGSTLDLLAFLARNLPAGCLLVLTYRSDDLGARPALRSLLAALARDRRNRRLELVRLTRAEVGTLIESVRGDAPTDLEVDAIYERSEGNPFIAEELLTAAENGVVPVSLQEVLLARASRFSRDAEEVTRLAAVIGRRVRDDVLAAATSWNGDRLSAAITQTVASGLLILDGAREEYSFRHVLTQEVVLDRLLPAERRRLHAAVAAALQAQPDMRRNAGRASECATHWYLAGQHEAALNAAITAGRLSAEVFAYAEAWRQYSRALTLDELVTDSGAATSVARQVLLAEAAEAARWTGAVDTAADLAQASADLAQTDRERARLNERIGQYLWEAGRTAEAQARLEQADKLLAGSSPSPLVASVAASLAHMRLLSGKHDAAIPLARHAIEVAGSVDAPAAEGRARITLGMSLVFCGGLAEGTEQVRRGHALVSRCGDLDDRRRGDSNLCYALLMAGDTTEACEVALSGLAFIRRYGLDASAGAALTANAVVLLRLTGRWQEADRLSMEALDAGIPDGQARYIHLARAELAIGRGDLDRGRVHLDEAWKLSREQTSPSLIADLKLAECELALERGDQLTARQHITDLAETLPDSVAARLVLQVCRLGLRTEGDLTQRSRLMHRPPAPVDPKAVEQLIERARKARLASPSPENDALATTAEAEYSRCLKASEPLRWREAAEKWRRLSRPREDAYCCLRWAEAELDTARSPKRATEPLRLSYNLATSLDAQSLRSEAEDVARRSRIRLDASQARHPATRSAAADLGLTPREQEILQCLVLGYTNRDIGQQLFLSHRTVAVHVSNVLAKLGVSTRGQAAASATKLRLLADREGDQ